MIDQALTQFNLSAQFSGSDILPGYQHAKPSMVANISRIQRSAEVEVTFGLLVNNRDVTPIRYCGGPLVVACGGGQLRILTENG